MTNFINLKMIKILKANFINHLMFKIITVLLLLNFLLTMVNFYY